MASDSESTSTPPPRSWDSIMPWEIRTQVFTECIKNRSVSLLFTNKQHYAAFYPLLHEKFVLSFSIDPSATPSKVDILDQNGHKVDATSAHPDYLSIIEDMPVDQFRRIEILINAPDPDDPGQLVRAWKQTTSLVAALLPRWKAAKEPETEADIELPKGRKTADLPPMIVKFQAKEEQKWTSIHPSLGRRIWSHSVPSHEHWNFESKMAPMKWDGIHSDLEIILTAFLRVRGAASLTFQFPDEVQHPPEDENPWITELMEEAGRLSRLRTPFGLYHGNDGYYGDYTIRREECEFHSWLDYLLDDMEGRSAARLRRERFENWCSEYDYLMGEAWGIASFSNSLSSHISTRYNDRFVAAVLYQEQDDRPGLPSWWCWSEGGVECRSENCLWPEDVVSTLQSGAPWYPEDRGDTTCTQWAYDMLRPNWRRFISCFNCCPVCDDVGVVIGTVHEEKQDLLVDYMNRFFEFPWDW